MRHIRLSEKILLLGYGMILIFMLVQDWVPLGKLNDIEAIKQENTTGELVVVTLIGVVQVVLFIFLILLFVGKKYPIFIKLWLVIHPSCILAGAIIDWWLPYLTGFGAENRIERYHTMFGETHAFLPIMNGIVPNTLHTLFHMTLLFCIILSIYIFVTEKRTRIINTQEKVS
ncbi:hypothetical protein [Ornithinibacillus californiensis]|uniref:hypothetical protein n=1 Tax=Ornithinibacillus californiensis TaxID=161536 RepID=UPI00064D7543|nr:hypothetical protein [Ornithinibacillus californiensis]